MKSFGKSKAKMSLGSLPPKPTYFELILWFLGFRKCHIVSGNSMLPWLSPGDQVLAKKNLSLSVGTMVIAKHPEKNLSIVKVISQILPDNKVCLRGTNLEESSTFCHLPTGKILGIVSSIQKSSVLY